MSWVKVLHVFCLLSKAQVSPGVHLTDVNQMDEQGINREGCSGEEQATQGKAAKRLRRKQRLHGNVTQPHLGIYTDCHSKFDITIENRLSGRPKSQLPPNGKTDGKSCWKPGVCCINKAWLFWLTSQPALFTMVTMANGETPIFQW